jgi:hypothetical protein
MPRARIPYEELEAAARKKYPYPIFRNVQVLRRSRYNDIKAPTVVYDRSTGNYARIGFNCQITAEMFAGMVESAPSWLGYSRQRGYEVEYNSISFTDVLQPEE